MRYLILIYYFTIMICSLSAQNLEMNIRYPADQDTINRAKTRLAATISDTNAVVSLNDSPLRVYSSGVFVSLLKLHPGWNQFVFTAHTENQELIDTVNVFRPKPMEALPEEPPQFKDNLLLPVSDITFYNPGQLIVQFMGSPGGKATFEIDDLIDDPLPMIELPEAKFGIRGIYRGVYQIQPGDQCENENIVFFLEAKNGDEEEWESERKVTVIKKGQPFVLKTSCENNLVYYQPRGEIFLELPEGIKLSAIAESKGGYHVRIADRITGYISARCVDKMGWGHDLPHALFGGLSSEIANEWLTFSMRVSEQVPFKLIQKQIPQSLELTFYGTSVQDEWSVLPKYDYISNPDSSFLKYFEWKQINDEELRFTFHLNTSQQWGYRGWYEDNIFKLALRIPPEISIDKPFNNLIIALDAGHGGDHSGAVGATGYEEKEANLKYTHYLAELLREAGADVILTRSTDTTMNLKPRADIARDNNAHILVWLHNNSIGSSSDPELVKGASTYYTHAQGMPFALHVYPKLLDIGLEPFGRVHRTYYITRQTDFIVFLVEGAFLSNPEDEIFLMNEDNLKKLAQAVYDGMETYLKKIAK